MSAADFRQAARLDDASWAATLQSLEGSDWGNPQQQDTGLIQECLRLRRVPLGGLSVENLRLLIGQNIGLPFLVPLAIEWLRQDPLAEGGCYAGDLLASVLRSEAAFWGTRSALRQEIAAIAERALLISDDDEQIGPLVPEYIREALQEFYARNA